MKRVFIVVVVVLLILIGFMAIFFKIADVPAIKDGSSFDIEKYDKGGLWLFHQLLQKRYGEENVTIVNNDNLDLVDEPGHLLIAINESLFLDSIETQKMIDFVAQGNEILTITSRYMIYNDTLSAVSLNHANHRDTIIQMTWHDSTKYDYHHEEIGISNPRYMRQSHYNRMTNDSLFRDYQYEDLLYMEDSLSVFRRVPVEEGDFYYHTMPHLFTNVGPLRTNYLTNFNKTFDHFNSEKVILYQRARKRIDHGLNDQSKLQYILSQPPLKYAYYLTLLLGLIYVAFASKRKQRTIPLQEVSKNTSLEYIETMSTLYQAQGQNEKLVVHIKNNFYHKVTTQYYLDRNDPEFAMKLSQKSKIPISQIEGIIKQLEIANNYTFNDDQLIRLYKDIDSFDKNKH